MIMGSRRHQVKLEQPSSIKAIRSSSVGSGRVGRRADVVTEVERRRQ
jgi:hypothetical protein